jgi:branched-chain amino acid transport system ATP-binding protein
MLEIKDLRVSYGKVEALKGINIKINKGEIISIIGNNGAGKSTLINTITGIIKPTEGYVIFEDKEITSLTTDKIVELGIIQVPEGREIFNDLTVRENLELGAYLLYKKKSPEEINKIMENAFSIFPFLKKRQHQIAGTLSGGEQQMLAISRGLMAQPKLMLLDEPSLGLAPLIVNEVFNVIKELRKSGTTFLIVEQNAFSALKISNRAYILELGNIILEGESKNLINDSRIKDSFLGKKNSA